MNAERWRSLSQPVLGSGWRYAKTLAYRVPVGWNLHGLLAEDSAARAPDFYLWVVRMPLFVPTDVIDLSWSERFGGSSRVFEPEGTEAAQAVATAAEEVIEQSSDEALRLPPPGGADNVGMQEARGYALLLEGNPSGALEVLGRVLRYEPEYEWDQAIADRARQIKSMVEQNRTSDALSVLETWRSKSLTALGMSDK